MAEPTNKGSRRFLLLILAIFSSICGVEPLNPSGAFLAESFSRIFYKLPAPGPARETSSLLPTSGKSLCRSGGAFSSLLGAGEPYCCGISPALSRWPARTCGAAAARGRAQPPNNSSCLKKDTEGDFRCFSTKVRYTRFPSSRLFSFNKYEFSAPYIFTRETGRCRLMPENVLFLDPAACPKTRRTLAVTRTSAARTAHQISEKEPSQLFDALKRLRSLTGCSVVACREALVTCDGDIHSAVDWLRRKGIAGPGSATTQVSNTPERLQTEGVVAVASWRPSAAQEGSNRQKERRKGGARETTSRRHEGEVALRLSCSTDFVARNKRITQFARRAATLLAEHLRQVGLQDVLTDSSATKPHAERRKETCDSTSSPEQAAGERPTSTSLPQPSLQSSSIVLVRGTPLVERLLSLPWEPGEEPTKEGENSDSFTAETSLSGGRNFFQEQQQLAGALQQQKNRQSARLSEKAKGQEQEQTKHKKLADGCTAKERALRGTQSTVREELQYLSSIVREPLSIADVVSVEAPVDSGSVASYVHGIIDNQVGTLAVLAALSVEHDRNKCNGRAPHQQSSTRVAAATLDEVKEKKRVLQGLRLNQQQLQPEEENSQRPRGSRTEKERGTPLSQHQQPRQDVLQRKEEPSSEVASIYELAERMRSLAEGVCMQIAAGRPVAVDEHSLDRALLEGEESIYRAQAEATGKPPATVERMVTGKLNKWLKDVLLVKQTWLLDDSGMTVQQKLSAFAAQHQMEKSPRVETFVKIQVH